MGPLIRTADHRYRLGDGPFVPGATGVTRIMDKGYAFENWLKDQVAFSAAHNLDFLRELIDKGGERAAAAYLSKLPDWERDKAGESGSKVHDLADRITKGLKPQVPAELVRHIQGELRFRRDHPSKKRRSEVMTYSHAGYGSTVDEISELEGETVIIERKTGKLYEQVRLQLAAQAHSDLIGYGNKVYTMPKVKRTFVLHLRPDDYAEGYRLIEYHLTDEDFDAFLACLRLTNWRAGLNWKGI